MKAKKVVLTTVGVIAVGLVCGAAFHYARKVVGESAKVIVDAVSSK